MFCSNCGSPVGEQEKFCKVCGKPVNVQAAAPAAQPAPVAQPAPAPAPAAQPVTVQQPITPQPAPAVYQQPVAPQPAPAVYQQPVQAPVQAAATAPAKEKGGPRRTCFVVGLITCIMLIVMNVPVFAIGGMMLLVGPFAMMLGASNSEELFGWGLLVCLGAALLVALAVISIVFNGISSKVTAKRPESKCKTFRMAAAIMVLIDALITIAPVIGLNNMMSDAEFFYGLYGLVLIMAIIFFVLAIITNSKEKKLASA